MERPYLKRRLTAVLLADVVGYSRLMSADEDGTHIRLVDCIKNLFEPTVALHEGRLVRSKGDGFLVEFDSAVNAVSCAVDIQRGLAALDDGSAGDRKLQLRIGINSGDVIVDQNDIYGNSVNIAARLEVGGTWWDIHHQGRLRTVARAPRTFLRGCRGSVG
jgi:adenylate cyclase